MDAVVAWARERGVGQVVLWVTRGNEAATLLYRRREEKPEIALPAK